MSLLIHASESNLDGMERIFFVGGVADGQPSRAFEPSRDMAGLQQAIKELGGAGLIIVDPIINAIAGDSHKNAEIQRGL